MGEPASRVVQLPPCEVCGFSDWPAGGMHAARSIHMRAHEREAKAQPFHDHWERRGGPVLRILLSGIPGGGKTTVGNLLAEHHGFVHVDMEEREFAAAKLIRTDPDRFLAELPPGDVVLSWGFGVLDDVASVDLLFRRGWRGVWFDGDRAWFLRSFLGRRSSLSLEVAFYLQVVSIIHADVPGRWPWVMLNPFDGDGRFRPGLPAAVLHAAAGVKSDGIEATGWDMGHRAGFDLGYRSAVSEVEGIAGSVAGPDLVEELRRRHLGVAGELFGEAWMR